MSGRLKRYLRMSDEVTESMHDSEWCKADEVTALETELQYAWTCPHGNDYRDHGCLSCWGDGTEVMVRCDECDAGTWHRGGVCLRHNLENAPEAYEAIKKVVLEAERISTEAHLAADIYGYDLMRTVLRPLEYDSD